VTLIGSERHLPYERPELSKDFLAGRVAADRLVVATQEEYDDADIALRLGTTVVGADLDQRRLLLDDGDSLGYDALVIATGSVNLRPPLPGIDLPGVHQLRSLDEAQALAAAAAEAERAVVVGMGLVGSEIVATLRERGLDVTAVDPQPGPLWQVLGARLSAMVRGWHEDHNVTIIDRARVAAIEGDGRVERVLLADGRRLDADLVVVGVGARAAIDWLQDAPVHLAQGGVGVDSEMRTSAQNVYAAGDVAAVWDEAASRHRRTEHYQSAIDQGGRAAHAIAGAEPPQARPGWFWTTQYGHYLQCAGECADEDLLVERPDPFVAYFLRNDVLRGVVTVDNSREFRQAMKVLGQPWSNVEGLRPATQLRT
jgi:3-phenylpropionate/trans-cinnamate dioxygenase ferredoxin reductase subunit